VTFSGSEVSCDLNNQKSIMAENYEQFTIRKRKTGTATSSMATSSKPEATVLFYDSSHCIECSVLSETKNSSDAIARRNFTVTFEPIESMLQVPEPAEYVKAEEISRIFHKQVVSYLDMELICGDLQELSIATETTIPAMINKVKATLGKANKVVPMTLNYDLPYNDWLYMLMTDKLKPLGFAIFQRDKAYLKSPAPFCEYIYCKSDILLYNPNFSESPVAVNIRFNSMDEDTTSEAELTELKVEKPDSFDAAINETFYNMFGEAVKLIVNTLCKGRLVQTATIYGILVFVHEHKQAHLLKLTINFKDMKCVFEQSAVASSFVHLLNSIISVLK